MFTVQRKTSLRVRMFGSLPTGASWDFGGRRVEVPGYGEPPRVGAERNWKKLRGGRGTGRRAYPAFLGQRPWSIESWAKPMPAGRANNQLGRRFHGKPEFVVPASDSGNSVA